MKELTNKQILKHLEQSFCVINKLTIESEKNFKMVKLEIETELIKLVLKLINASSIKVDFHMSDLVIHGICINDNIGRGWSKEVRYHLADLEDGLFDLYFEDYVIQIIK